MKTPLLVLVVVVSVASCSKAPKPTAPNISGSMERGSTEIDEARAIEIAKAAVATNDTWADRATYEAMRDAEGWFVIVWRIEGYDADGNPLFVPGGHRLITIDNEGNVTDYMRGK